MDNNFVRDCLWGTMYAEKVTNALIVMGWKACTLPSLNNMGGDVIAISPKGIRHLIEVKANRGCNLSGEHYDTFILETFRDMVKQSPSLWRIEPITMLVICDASTDMAHVYNARKLQQSVQVLIDQGTQQVKSGNGIGTAGGHSWGYKIPWQDKSFGWITSVSI